MRPPKCGLAHLLAIAEAQRTMIAQLVNGNATAAAALDMEAAMQRAREHFHDCESCESD